jgi:hypothetical protein
MTLVSILVLLISFSNVSLVFAAVGHLLMHPRFLDFIILGAL